MMLSGLTQVVITNNKKPFCIASTKGLFFFGSQVTNEVIINILKFVSTMAVNAPLLRLLLMQQPKPMQNIKRKF